MDIGECLDDGKAFSPFHQPFYIAQNCFPEYILEKLQKACWDADKAIENLHLVETNDSDFFGIVNLHVSYHVESFIKQVFGNKNVPTITKPTIHYLDNYLSIFEKNDEKALSFHNPQLGGCDSKGMSIMVCLDIEENKGGDTRFFKSFNPKQYSNDSITIKHKVNQIVIFPQSMVHLVLPYLGDKKRIMMFSDFTLTGTVFKESHSLQYNSEVIEWDLFTGE